MARYFDFNFLVALARVIIKVLRHQHTVVDRCFPGGYNVRLVNISSGQHVSMVVTDILW